MDTQAYVTELCSRFGARQRVRFDPERASENGSLVGRCHENVDAWVAAHPGDQAVGGWVTWHAVFGGVRLTAHSVVRGTGGDLFDITPLGDESYRAGMEFVPHIGDEAAFFEMKAAVNAFDCLEPAPT
jgi:hypothetical protein